MTPQLKFIPATSACEQSIPVRQTAETKAQLRVFRNGSMPSIERVRELTLNHFHISLADCMRHARSRKAEWCVPRQVGMYLARALTGAPFPTIAEHFGVRAHGSAIHAYRKMELWRNTYPEVKEATEKISAQLVELQNALRIEGDGK